MLDLLKINQEMLEEERPENYSNEWIPESDEQLEWYIDTINNEIEQNKAVITMIKDKINRYNARLEKLMQDNKEKMEQIEHKADIYIETQDKSKLKVTKTQEKLVLAGVEVIRKKNNYKVVKDEDKLLEYVKKSERKELIKMKESVDWAEYKKQLQETENGYVDKETGEIIEGITLQAPEREYSIKIKELI